MRIWVARPEPGAARTAERLRALGHRPLVAPVLVVMATEAPRPSGAFDGVLITSGQSAGMLAGSGLAADVPVFAVGGRTADAARAAGIARVIAAEGDAEALARRVQASLPTGASLLHIAGADRKAEPGASLGAAGYRVIVWEAYAARPVDMLPLAVAEALRDRSLAAALHFSRRSTATTLQLAQTAGLDGAFRMVEHYCLSADVAVPLVEAGLVAHFVAARPSEEALLAGLPHPA
ncbi:uroporphyrinogen-III synthase [Methylobacterium haplocladii]|uniref:Uroporphyrinogen III methyltransferase n=1 Tax=Methylobacterium haplocladii TaxID=1176176 RepID=A0A512IUJ7_9HYPH|nr:uroporphyrinogen-III synthase [Methylobacterium haplocladii]GEP01373.1 uroporphyrinogen III methyltransferase [Methylobacterium haplocladii]GJD83825.1 hypothetical protein HPGCJGGD_1698 [Methylobacterium haplocladii]GLS58264.1 uroporphyrinogen III methyltransferase [Methylobacterium haplocladii]